MNEGHFGREVGQLLLSEGCVRDDEGPCKLTSMHPRTESRTPQILYTSPCVCTHARTL